MGPGDTLLIAFDGADTISHITLTAQVKGTFAFFVEPRVIPTILEVGGPGIPFTVGVAAQPSAHRDNLTRWRTERFDVAVGDPVGVTLKRSPAQVGDTVRVWLYQVNQAPEHVPVAIAAGQIVSGEGLENSADVDTFTVNGAAGQTGIGFLESDSLLSNGSIRLTVATTAGAPLGLPVLSDSIPGLERQATGRYLLPFSGPYRVTVAGEALPQGNKQPNAVGYRMQVRHVNLGPEAVGLLLPGDSLSGEAIDYVGDFDRYTVPVTPGRWYNVFIQKLEAPDKGRLTLRYTTQGSENEVVTGEKDSLLADHFAGVFKAAGTSVVVDVTGLSDRTGLDRGPYRLFVYEIDTLPEHSPAVLSPGSSVEERFELAGDIDRYTIAAPDDTVLLQFSRTDTTSYPLDFLWADHTGPHQGQCYPARVHEGNCASNFLITGAGGGSVLVSSMGSPASRFTTPYRVDVDVVNSAPETAPPILSGTTVVSDAIPQQQDMDVYTLAGPPGAPVKLELSGAGDNLTGYLVHPNGNTLNIGTVQGTSTGRFYLPWSGQYRFFVAGASYGAVPTEVGNYTLTMTQFATTPETAPVTLAAGDSITETIGFLGDVDDFTYTGTPGTLVDAVLAPFNFLPIETWVPGDTLPLAVGDFGSSGRITVPAGGVLRFRVAQPRGFGPWEYMAYGITGPYGLALHVINPAPEHLPSLVLVGDTVAGEKLDVAGDIDEFTFSGTQGQTRTLMLDDFATLSLFRLRAEVIQPGTNAAIATVSTESATPNTTAPFVLPETGTYRIRIQSTNPLGGTGPYRFSIR